MSLIRVPTIIAPRFRQAGAAGMMLSGRGAGGGGSGAVKYQWFKRGVGFFSDLGSTPQTTNGGAIMQWSNTSGAGANATHASAPTSARPTLDTATTWQGQPTVKFISASQQGFHIGNPPNFLHAQFFLAVMFASDPPSTANAYLKLGVSGNGNFGSYLTTAGKLNDCTGSATGTDFDPIVSMSSTFRIISVSFTTTPSNTRTVKVDGTPIGTDTAATMVLNTVDAMLGMDDGGPGHYSDMWVAEFLLYDRILTTFEEAVTLNYLNGLTGLPA